MEGSSDILALSELITGYQNVYDEEEEEHTARQSQLATLTPSTIGASSANVAVDRPIGQIKTVDPKAIWDPEEVPSDDEDDEVYEIRSRPNFEILYKQSVMTEDVFLGLSDKDPSFANCEAMVVRVECPQHRLEDIELDVKKQKLLLQSSTL